MCILCDQLRADFLSCYNPNSPVQTPNIDSLTKDGILFEHAITASPVCAPGRASIMTGRYVSDHQVWTNDVPFRDGIDYLPARMRENGYICGSFGKLHHFPARDTKGFHEAWQMEENRLKNDDDYFQYLKNLHPEITDLFQINDNSNFKFSKEEYYESQIASRAIKFIDKNKGKSPFFTWVSFQGPHTPMDPPELDYNVSSVPSPILPDYDPFCEVPLYRKSRGNLLNSKEVERYRLDYARMIEFIDGKIGEIIAYLKKEELYENTVILFSTDHGELCGDYSMYQKGPFLYQAQLEVPLIIANHPDLPKAHTTTMLTSNLDIGSTFLSVAGDKKPLGYSRDIAEMYCNPEVQRNTIYSEFCDSMKLISDKEYRFAYYPFTGECELVRISDETVNLSTNPEYQTLVSKYLKDIIDYMVIAKGVGIEAQDLTPKVQQGLQDKLPEYKNIVPLAFPIANITQINALKRDGLNSSYNEFCKDREIYRCYGMYWKEKK